MSIDKISIDSSRLDVNPDDLSEKDRIYFNTILEQVIYEANRELFYYNNKIIKYLEEIIGLTIKQRIEYGRIKSKQDAIKIVNDCNVDEFNHVIAVLKQAFDEQEKGKS